MPRHKVLTTAEGVRATVAMTFENATEVPLEADFSYAVEDPYAISVLFRSNTQSIRWIFGRELLAQGISEAAGSGDVLIWPTLDRLGTALVVVQLSSPDGVVRVQAPSANISRFLSATYGVVPRGDESNRLDLDGELARLLCPTPGCGLKGQCVEHCAAAKSAQQPRSTGRARSRGRHIW